MQGCEDLVVDWTRTKGSVENDLLMKLLDGGTTQ